MRIFNPWLPRLSYFMFNVILYKKNNCVAMGSPLGPTVANVSCRFMKWKNLNSTLMNSNQFLRDMLTIFLFYLIQLNMSQNFIIHVILTCLFLFEWEVNGKLSFLDAEVSRQEGKYVTAVYRKPTFSGVHTHFDSSLPTDYKVGVIYTLAYRCFKFFSDWAIFDEELNFLKHVFSKNGYAL